MELNNNGPSDFSDSVYSAKRFFASSTKAFVSGTQEELSFEIKVEMVLNQIFEALNSAIENYLLNDDKEVDPKPQDMYVRVKLDDRTPVDIKREVVARLEDFGYGVEYLADSEEEFEVFQELLEMAKEDETIAQALVEAQDATFELKVSWGDPYPDSK